MLKVEPGENSYRKTKLISFLVQLLPCWNVSTGGFFLPTRSILFILLKCPCYVEMFFCQYSFFLAIVASK